MVREGDYLSFRGGRERALLALLVLNANRIVSADRLAEDLWSGDPPEGAIRSLRVYVSRLRQALGVAGQVVVTRPSGYLLQVDPDAVDALRFEQLVARGRVNRSAGDHTGAAATLREALGLWRGPALADVADAPFARVEASRLEEGRLAALEDRIEADLACGRHGEVTAELEALTREHPFRERLWSQRLVALYRSGRQADALRAYQDLRSTLREQLGIEPGPALQHLEGAILRHDPELDRHLGGTGFLPPGPPAQAGEEAGAGGAVVTFLFTDLVGSTELLDDLGEEAAEQTRRTHFGLLRGAVTAHGGSEVKSLGDGLMVAFASPLAALRCAVEMQTTLSGAPPRAGKALAIRVGLHAGQPMRDEGDFHGTPVVVAKRLCDRAGGGQILASVLVSDLIGSRSDEFAFRHLGPLPLKGLAAPVAACEVLPRAAVETASSGATAAPGRLPQPLSRQERLPLVGREGELSLLDEIWLATDSGQRQLVLLAGDPGIGKSRLAAEFARTAHDRGTLVLFGRCDEGMGVPYQPFVEALSRYLRQAPHLFLGRLAGELVRLVPEVGERIHGLPPPLRSDPETERYRLFDAVAAWLGAASEATPVLFVIEDLHWATKPTLLLLSHLLRSDEDLRLLLMVTFRDTPLDMTPDLADLVAELLRQPGVGRVRLAGLTEPGVGALMEAQAGHDLDDEGWALARIVHDETAGNPFYVGEMLRLLAEKGDIVRRDGRWVPGQPLAQLDVPDSVRDVVERRLTRLPDRTSEMLALAAVLGERFELALLAQASGESDRSIIETLRPAVSARLVTETDAGSYQFTHALVRSALEDALGPTRAVQLHRAAGFAVEAVHAGRLDPHLPQLAHHFAEAREVQKGIAYASRAGDRALTQLAPDEAVAYYRQALELLDAAEAAEEQRLGLLIALGEAQRQAGDPAHRETLLCASRLAAERGDAEAHARAALANTRGFYPSAVGEVDDDRVASLQAALEATGDDEPPTRARLLAALGTELLYAGDLERRMRLADEALAIARRARDDSTLAHVLLQNYFPILTPDTLEKRLACTEELVPLAQSLGDPVIVARALLLRFRVLTESGNVEAADPYLDQAERLAEELGQPTLRFLVGHFRTARTILAGDLEEGERRAHAGFELGQATGQRDAPRILAIQLFGVRFDQGRLGELEERLAERVAAVPGLLVLRAFLALLLCELDRPDEAIEHYELLAVENFTGMPLNPAWIHTMPACAGVCASIGDRARAPVLFHLLEPYASQLAFTPAGSLGAVAHYLAILATTFGDFEEAERRFADAAATHERIGAPTWLARTRLEWARMLINRAQPGDAERAREFLGQALETARELGLANVERRAVQLRSKE
ncbi:MAG TPA: BTAD domain-containing putative transcriptional regulator [Acidimicrobiia bacterium]|nr:BTAD domain-containing putative transcriptional regulator [Acidimicrobiia bacterium]